MDVDLSKATRTGKYCALLINSSLIFSLDLLTGHFSLQTLNIELKLFKVEFYPHFYNASWDALNTVPPGTAAAIDRKHQ